MNRWDDLSLQEKNQLLGIYASKGYTDLASIISHYNTFQAGGTVSKVTSYGQWEYPGEVTTIPSNSITMKGVDYPVIGVSNTGDTKYMLPNMDYLFNGQYVTEYPVHKFQEGGVGTTTPTRQLPQVNITGDIAQDWITSWTSNRKSQLRNNYLNSRNVFRRMKDSVTGNKNEEIENDILSKQLEGMYNMEQYISSNPLEVYSSDNPDYKVKKKDINNWVSGDTLAETFHKPNKIYYNPTDTDFKGVSEVPFTLRVHENTHALADSYRDRNKHAKTPQEKIIDKKYRKYFLENYDNYLSQPSEIYSRLMELRFKTGLKPTDKVDWDWYIEHQDAIKNLHLLFDENKLIDLLNEVAVNDKAHQESNYV